MLKIVVAGAMAAFATAQECPNIPDTTVCRHPINATKLLQTAVGKSWAYYPF
jgi:hypothetical protein